MAIPTLLVIDFELRVPACQLLIRSRAHSRDRGADEKFAADKAAHGIAWQTEDQRRALAVPRDAEPQRLPRLQVQLMKNLLDPQG